MNFLLDTHALIWFMANNQQLPNSLMERLVDTSNRLCVSRVTLWEITIKAQLDKPDFQLSFATWLERFYQFDFELLEITDAHLLQLSQLPQIPDHRDPFDRLLIAQALTENLTLVSRDGKFASYAYAGLHTLWG